MTNAAFTVTAYQSAFLAVNNDNDDGVAMAAQGSQPPPPTPRRAALPPPLNLPFDEFFMG